MPAVLWVLDLDGVVWLGDRPIPGAAAAVARLRRDGETVLFVTNNSSRRVDACEQELFSHGIDARGAVITSAMAAASLVPRGARVLVCAGEGVIEALAVRDVELVDDGPADVVVVGYHRSFDYAGMTRAAVAVRDGARLIATNDDATYPTPAGPIPGGGAILASIVTATGVSPEVAGKPHEPIAALVRQYGAPATAGIVVGDRPSTDGGLAAALGFRFALVETGVTRAGEQVPGPPADIVAPDLLTVVDGERGPDPGS